jgi:hypothetical protein
MAGVAESRWPGGIKAESVVGSEAKLLKHFHFPYSTCHFSFVIAYRRYSGNGE